jgi:hypothetical protein
MATRGLQQLPVVTREQPHRVIGLLSQDDVALAQTIARSREIFQHHLETKKLEALLHGSECDLEEMSPEAASQETSQESVPQEVSVGD